LQQVRCGVERASQTLQTLRRPDAASEEEEEVTENGGGRPVLLRLRDLRDDGGLPVGVLLQDQVRGHAASLKRPALLPVEFDELGGNVPRVEIQRRARTVAFLGETRFGMLDATILCLPSSGSGN
jgi:hypothetical protein